MCGIAAIVRAEGAPVREEQLLAMMRAMKHRGPDDQGVHLEGGLGLGFVRLKIIDLSENGHQPMHSADGRYVIIFNGEIFNYIELRQELIVKGHTFRTATDTEVLLAAYMEWGEGMLDRLNGMWSFIILDRQQRSLFCARDRYGIKPFYYCVDGDRIIMASEPPAILSVLGRKPEPDTDTIYGFLAFNRTDQNDRSFFKGIRKLMHGHFMRIDLRAPAVEPVRWYNLRERIKEPFNAPAAYREMFISAVGLRLRSDVPVGVCLSGGLDSSSIVGTLLHDHGFKGLNTFSAVYGHGRTGDESAYIALFKDQLDRMHFTEPDEHGLMADLDDLTKAQLEPVPSTSTYAQYRVMKLAKEHVVVTLDGQGADETLGGYDYFFGYFFKQLLRQGQLARLASEMKHYAKNHSSTYGFKSMAFFMLPASLRNMARVAEKGYIARDFHQAHKERSGDVTEQLYGSNSMRDALIDHFEYKLEHLLKWEDRSSMWFSLEARVPYLDHRLVEQTIAMADHWFIHRGMTKHILREAMQGAVPEPIRLRRDKVGFETPEAEWFRTPLFKTYIKDMLHSKRFETRGVVDIIKVRRMYDAHLHRRGDHSKEIWKLIHLDKWYQHFVD